MKFSKLLIAAFAVITFAATANVVQAQSTTVTASGTVLTPITLSGTNLSFGSEIFPGINKTVVPSASSGAAQFDIGGEGGKEVEVSFTLPTVLTETGGSELAVSFATGDAGHSTSSTGTPTTYDPNTILSTTLDATNGTLYVWLGGTVEPTNTQTAGDYSANITADVSYTGN